MGYLDRTTQIDGRRVLLFEWEGRTVRVWNDADTALRIHELFRSGEDSSQKLSGLISGLFVDQQELSGINSLSGLIAAVCWECCALDVDGSHADEVGSEKVFDWEADAEYIAPSLLMCYGVSWDEARYRYSYRQLCGMLGMVAHDTPMGQALYYRTATPPEPRKGNEEERRSFRKLQSFWRLKEPGRKDPYADVNAKMNDAFAGLERLAKGD